MNKEYITKLLEKTKEFNELTNRFFEIEDEASSRVSHSRNQNEIEYMSKAKALIGFIESLEILNK